MKTPEAPRYVCLSLPSLKEPKRTWAELIGPNNMRNLSASQRKRVDKLIRFIVRDSSGAYWFRRIIKYTKFTPGRNYLKAELRNTESTNKYKLEKKRTLEKFKRLGLIKKIKNTTYKNTIVTLNEKSILTFHGTPKGSHRRIATDIPHDSLSDNAYRLGLWFLISAQPDNGEHYAILSGDKSDVWRAGLTPGEANDAIAELQSIDFLSTTYTNTRKGKKRAELKDLSHGEHIGFSCVVKHVDITKQEYIEEKQQEIADVNYPEYPEDPEYPEAVDEVKPKHTEVLHMSAVEALPSDLKAVVKQFYEQASQLRDYPFNYKAENTKWASLPEVAESEAAVITYITKLITRETFSLDFEVLRHTILANKQPVPEGVFKLHEELDDVFTKYMYVKKDAVKWFSRYTSDEDIKEEIVSFMNKEKEYPLEKLCMCHIVKREYPRLTNWIDTEYYDSLKSLKYEKTIQAGIQMGNEKLNRMVEQYRHEIRIMWDRPQASREWLEIHENEWKNNSSKTTTAETHDYY